MLHRTFYLKTTRRPDISPTTVNPKEPNEIRVRRTCYTAIMSETLTFAAQLACEAGKMLREIFSLSGTKANLKEDRTVVTEADLAVDRLIGEAILERFPEDALISEELQPGYSAAADYSGKEVRPKSLKGKAVWVIDPLDGTTNFSLGLHYWGVSVARLVDGWPETAAAYFPALDELYSAQRGKGATLNGERIHSRPPDRERPTAFFSCCSRTHRRYDVKVRYKTRILGSAVYDLCSVARGTAVLGFEATPKIWDIAGSWLIVEEAGGVVETHDGSKPFPLEVLRDYNQQIYPTIAAANHELLARAREWIRARQGRGGLDGISTSG